MLDRLADPYWFQAFGCVLGFDWHSSGLTTVTCGALGETYRRMSGDLGIHVAGGKGGASRKTPGQIARTADRLSLEGERLIYASRMTAKVDSAALQDGYQVYTHHFFFTYGNDWCVVQQGMVVPIVRLDSGQGERLNALRPLTPSESGAELTPSPRSPRESSRGSPQAHRPS